MITLPMFVEKSWSFKPFSFLSELVGKYFYFNVLQLFEHFLQKLNYLNNLVRHVIDIISVKQTSIMSRICQQNIPVISNCLCEQEMVEVFGKIIVSKENTYIIV